MRRIRRDDTVLVIGGKERGKQGQVRDVYPDKGSAVIQGLNMVKRHERNRGDNKPSGIIEKEAPIHLSNLKLICKSCQKPARVGYRVRSDGVKVRVCKACKQDID
jgi:large subunit ribosomal protein L24